MKRVFIFAFICTVLASCSNEFKVEGTVSNQEALDNGAIVIVNNDATRESDTLTVTEGKFSFVAPASDTISYIFRLSTSNPDIRVKSTVRCIAEKGVVKIDLGEKANITTSGKLNKGMMELRDFIKHNYSEYERLTDSLKNVLVAGPELEKAAEKVSDSLSALINETCRKYFKENPNNALGLEALRNGIYEMTLEELEETLESAGPYIKGNTSVKRVLEAKKQAKATAEGEMFVDFEGKSPEGEVARLSDFVGRGKYTLVDFWASWCGPCKREIPNIRSLYEKYADKGLVVVGVAVWDNDNSGSRQTMEELSMKWNQIFMGTDMTPTDKYGIEGIPQIILFGPDGTILKRDLREQELISTVSALYE